MNNEPIFSMLNGKPCNDYFDCSTELVCFPGGVLTNGFCCESGSYYYFGDAECESGCYPEGYPTETDCANGTPRDPQNTYFPAAADLPYYPYKCCDQVCVESMAFWDTNC